MTNVPDVETPQVRRSRDRRLLAELLEHNSHLTTAALRRHEKKSARQGSALGSLMVARTLEDISSDVLRVLVMDARGAGYTWQQIGEALHVTRQAAQQRFGGADDGADSVGRREAVGPARRALIAVDQWRQGRLESLRQGFDRSMADALSVEGLTQAWSQVEDLMGEVTSVGQPTVTSRGRYQVVDVPLVFQRGTMKARVTLDRKERICGLFILQPDVV